ncbi:MAG: pyrroline-5-carboxylate reductase [Alphaproteobacteria bacterium]
MSPVADLKLQRPILLVGCGKMGGALAHAWLDRKIATAGIFIVDPVTPAGLVDRPEVTVVADADNLPDRLVPAAVLLAIKPQQMEAVLPAYARFATDDTVFLSIAAGKTTATLSQYLGSAAIICRAMPNTPTALGQGMTVLCKGPNLTESQGAMCEALMAVVGETAWVDTETLMDPVTALSGGGPAYVFLLIEVLAAAGVKAGLEPSFAMRLARTTVIGSAELAHQSKATVTNLRQNVTSPGGTTAEALKILMGDGGMQSLFDAAIAAATARARELAQ